MPENNGQLIVDGSMDFSGGVDSGRNPTVQSEGNENGLPRNMLAWLNNATVRGGGIQQRATWQKRCTVVDGGTVSNVYKVTLQNLTALPVGGTVAPGSYSGEIGPNFVPFIIPPTNQSVNVFTSVPYTGALGITISLAGGNWIVIAAFTSSVGRLYQSGAMYVPDAGNPYLMLSIGGHIYQVRVDTDYSVVDVTGGNVNPPNEPLGFMQQSEQFLVIQAGDGATLPLFWDGVGLRRSNGITGNTSYPNINELPAAFCMDYYEQRLWYSLGKKYTAGDIVGNTASGTAAYGYRDSVLKVTENPLAVGGDGFAVPASDTNIRALAHTANLNASLGQGQLFAFTRQNIYSLDVPINRTAWIAADANDQPQQSVAQKKYGSPGNRGVVPVNGDLYYQTIEPGVRSLSLAVRNFNQWGNTPISSNVNRVLQFNDRELLRYGSGIIFDNRLWETCLPAQTNQGVVHRGITVLDFDLVSSLRDKLQTNNVPAWEGMYEGLDFLDLFTGDFGGLERAFALVRNTLTEELDIWELTLQDRFENGDNRVTWSIEFPAYTWRDPFMLKELVGGELWIDRLFGRIGFQVFYRPDQNPCWKKWHQWEECAARDCTEDSINPCLDQPYPLMNYGEQFRATRQFPKPPDDCDQTNSRPTVLGFQFQVKIVITGFCRIRGLLLYAQARDKSAYQYLVCTPTT